MRDWHVTEERRTGGARACAQRGGLGILVLGIGPKRHAKRVPRVSVDVRLLDARMLLERVSRATRPPDHNVQVSVYERSGVEHGVELLSQSHTSQCGATEQNQNAKVVFWL